MSSDPSGTGICPLEHSFEISVTVKHLGAGDGVVTGHREANG